MHAPSRMSPDAATVDAARAGDRDALDALVAQSLPLVYNIVGRALSGHADVDDVVQETLLRMVSHLADLRDPRAFRSWLVAIAIRQVRDRHHFQKTTQTRHAHLDDAGDVPDVAGDFVDVTIMRLGLTDQRREVAEATRWLAAEDRDLLSLWWLEETGEVDRRELAEALQLSAPHAAVRVARMKDQVETARTVVRALQARPGCMELYEIARTWDGEPSPLWRKRFGRHVRECEVCAPRTHGMLPMDRLLAGAPLVIVPPTVAANAARLLAKPVKALHATGKAHLLRHVFSGWHGVVTAATVTSVVAVTAVAVAAAGSDSPKPVAAPPTKAPVVTPFVSASPTASPSPSLKPTVTPSTHKAVPPVTPVTSQRKGVCVWTFSGVSKALAQSGASWYYTWSTNHNGVSTPKGVEFVPMIWGPGSVTASSLKAAKSAGKELLGFNEPDMSAQSNMPVSQALDLWPQLEATGLKLGSPSVAYGGDTPGGWLDQFMSGAKTRGYRVDFITLHWYGSDFTTPDAVNQLKSYIQAVYNRYHKPIWLTEFALISFSNGTHYPSESQQAAFVTASTKMLDGLPYLARYSWFGLPAADSGASTGLFHSGPTVTAVGKAFEAAR
jgi:RNA polymerase sigma factor (sigma-70 family)